MRSMGGSALALVAAMAVLVTAGGAASLAAASGAASPGDCAEVFRFGAEPVPVAKSGDGRTVLATVSWGYNADANLCYLVLDGPAIDTLRADPPSGAIPTPAPAPMCRDFHGFGAELVPVAKSRDGRTVLATVSWGYSAEANLCYLVLDGPAIDTLRAAQPVVWWSAGDSYSSGEGTGPENDLDEASVAFACAQARDVAYGPLAARILRSSHGWNIPAGRESFTACTGARFVSMLDVCHQTAQGICYGPQSAVRGRNEQADVITLTFGGNDIGFGRMMTCVGKPLCDALSLAAETRQAITRLREAAAVLYERIARDYLTPRGKLYVVGYPNITAPVHEWGWRWRCAIWISKEEAEMLARLGDHLNDSLSRAVLDADEELGGGRVYYLDTAALYRQGKHELCGDGENWLNAVPPLQLDDSFHPNIAGHQAMADALVAEVLRTFRH